MIRRRQRAALGLFVLMAALAFGAAAGPVQAQLSDQRQQPQAGAQKSDADARPYDAQLLRLAEIIGAIHYLRELCGADEGQLWRDQMRELVTAEGTSALRRAKLVDAFNRGYRGYSRTYRTCTQPAVVAIERFMEQGASLADAIIDTDR